ncbi:class D sortase [Caenibacillus caldisaponilyticus]|uniref:class D sortase n=1 Tax=Caenibacillus caldisaponilyticus TaxID=1674942 RepID=UPI00098851AD|nr:class D sortase [Caenibacillus caldisaponilyticus]
MKIIAYIFIVVGAICLSIGGWEWYATTHQEERALAKAEKLVAKTGDAPAKDQVSESDGKRHEKKAGDPSFAKDDVIGLLVLPRLDRKLPIVEGTDLKQLKKGVGHYIGTALPGGHDQIFLAGHRDTVFRHLGEMKKGDDVIIKMPYGTYRYKVTGSKIVPSDDRTIIRPTAPKETLVLASCYPFVFVGHAPDRFILYAEPAGSTKADQKS